MNRRDVIQKVLIGTTALIVIPSAFNSCTKTPISPTDNSTPPPAGTKITLDLTTTDYSALNSTGGSVVVQNIIVVNTGGGVFVALSSVCTHQGCTVNYSSSGSNFVCPCHGSSYTLTGSVVNGPAELPLKSYTVSKLGNIVTIQI